MPEQVYLDHAAGTALRPEALEAMTPFLLGFAGNASGLHRHSGRAHEALETARAAVADVLCASPEEVMFTSGGTESINAAIKSVALASLQAGTGDHVVTTEAEHQAVLNSCRYLERFGIDVTYLPVDEFGLVEPAAVAEALTPRTSLVSIAYANNEVGSVQAIEETVRVVREREQALRLHIAVHTDAVQAPGLLPLDVRAMGADMLSLSAHKFGGPAGMGALYVRRAIPFLPQMDGGAQERRRRAGTENIAGAAGMAKALQLAEDERSGIVPQLRLQRDRLCSALMSEVPWAMLNGHPERRLANNLNLSFPGIDGEALVVALSERGISASAGSACAHVSWEPSHVLLAMGRTLEEASGALRLSLGRDTTDGDIDAAIAAVPATVRELAARSPR